MRRVSLAAEDVRRLVKAGCFDALEGKSEGRPRLLSELLARGAAAGRGSPMSSCCRAAGPAGAAGLRRTRGLDQELEAPRDARLLPIPLDLRQRAIARIKPLPARELGAWAGRYMTMIGWWVTGKPVQDKDGRPMEFVTFEDTSGLFDATFFPQAYAVSAAADAAAALPSQGEGGGGVRGGDLTVEWVGYLDERG